MNNRILITGALGQLGKFFIDSLINQGDYVLATDIKNSNDLNCDFEIFDVHDLKKGDELIKKYKINQVYNFAAILSAKGEINPAKTWDLNNAGFFNILDICLKNKINKIFWPSSIAVFGKNSNLNFASIDEPMCPETIYGASKLACEKAMYYYNFKNIIDIRSLRFPGIISNSKPGGGTTDYIVDMLFSAAKKKDFTCFLKNDTVLPMMHINDAVDASIMLMSIDKKNISINTPYNISSFETSPSKWRDTINSLGYELKIDYEVDFRQDIADSWPKKVDDSLLRKDIDWIPKFNEKETALDILRSI